MKNANWNVLWVCQWEGEGSSSIHDTAEEAREYGLNRGDDEPFVVFPIRLQRWVSVSESLPPDGVPVLVRTRTRRQAQLAYCHATGVWQDYDNSYWSPSHVTHWMPTLVEPVAWPVMERDGFGIEVTFTDRDEAAEWCDNRQEIVPLYRHQRPTLTDDEWEAVEWAIDAASGMAQAEPWAAATLRQLLERLK